MAESTSLQKATWKRLKKNKGAVIGLAVIVFAILLSIFGYFVAADGTPHANRIILEVHNQKPGYTQEFTLVKKDIPAEKAGFFTRLLYGKEDKYNYIPVVSHEEKGDSIIAQRLIDEGISERIAWHKSQLAEKPFQKSTFLLGTDKFGRDIMSRIILGTRISLSVGLVTVIISMTIGLILGSLAGYFRGKTDSFILWFINVIWSIPGVLLVFAITFAMGKGFWQVFIAIGLTMWVSVARLVRGQVLAARELEYVEAARALGYSNFRIIARHIWPNIMGPVMVIAAANFASAIVIEAGLSFLGIGVQSPQPSWGLMIKENYNFIITQNPMLALTPGIAIMILVLAFNLLGNGLRDALNVRGRI